MFSQEISAICGRFPLNNKERFLIYPALAVYSPIEDSVRTVIGGVFTAISLVSLGLCPSINKVANWTRHSRTILSVPSQIIGNIFDIHSKILTDYNIRAPKAYAVLQTMMPAVSDVSEILLVKAEIVCTTLFQKRTETKLQLLTKHIIFRVYFLMEAAACTSMIGVISPLTAIVFIPLALYNQGKKALYNNFALTILKTPQIIHGICLTLRMVVNPLQFTKPFSGELAIDTKPLMNALDAPGIFWKNPLEFYEA